MAYVPMNRTRALIICTRPQDYAPARLREAARYLLDRRDTTEEEQRLATEGARGAAGQAGRSDQSGRDNFIERHRNARPPATDGQAKAEGKITAQSRETSERVPRPENFSERELIRWRPTDQRRV